MADTIEFVRTWYSEVDSADGRVRQVAYRQGTRVQAVVRPVENGKQSAGVADLLLADGTTARHVPRVHFLVVADQRRAA